MYSSSRFDAEVTPDILAWPEAELLNLATGGLETVIGILTSDAHGHNMACTAKAELDGSTVILHASTHS